MMIRDAVRNKGVSVAQMARDIGITVSLARNYMMNNGKIARPTRSVLYAMAEYCGVDPDELDNETQKEVFIDAAVTPPEGKLLLVSFDNIDAVLIAQYVKTVRGDGFFIAQGDNVPLSKRNLFVNGWMALPKGGNIL